MQLSKSQTVVTVPTTKTGSWGSGLGGWPYGTELSDSAHVTEAECVSSSLVGHHGPVAEILSHHDSGGSECALSQSR